MKRSWSFCLALAFAFTPFAAAGPAEEAIVAAVRLSEQPNYTWTSSVSDDARNYDVDGKYVRDSFTWVRMPAVNAVRKKLGRSATDTRIEAFFLGNVDCVIATEDGWRRPHEIPDPIDPDEEFDRILSPLGPAGLHGGSVVRAAGSRRPRPREAEPRPYSNLQLAISPPHEELGVIVSSHATFEVEGDTVSGQLTDLGAQLLLVRDGQKEITPIAAVGSFKLWLRGGQVWRYQLRLEGTLSVLTPRGRAHVGVQQTSLTTIRDVGTTSFRIPDEARLALLER